MKNFVKTLIDLVMGAVIPIIILDRFSGPEALGPVAAYIVAAMIPVGWVFIDLFFITKKFNFITSYVGFTSLVGGLLAFWFVDGITYAFKDTVGWMLRTLIFGGSILIGKPILKLFFAQALNADTPGKEQALNRLMSEPSVIRATNIATWIVVVESALAGIANFFLNWWMVLAPFGSELFNQQVAQVNAITRVALSVPSMLAFMIAMWIMFQAIYKQLPSEEGKQQLDSDFWDLVKLREGRELELS